MVREREAAPWNQIDLGIKWPPDSLDSFDWDNSTPAERVAALFQSSENPDSFQDTAERLGRSPLDLAAEHAANGQVELAMGYLRLVKEREGIEGEAMRRRENAIKALACRKAERFSRACGLVEEADVYREYADSF